MNVSMNACMGCFPLFGPMDFFLAKSNEQDKINLKG